MGKRGYPSMPPRVKILGLGQKTPSRHLPCPVIDACGFNHGSLDEDQDNGDEAGLRWTLHVQPN